MPASVEKLLNSQYVQLALAALAFIIALWFVVVIARMLMGGRLRLPGGRTRQARLGIVDAFDLDRQRQLIIVRRDNTEHLIMIGGPNDLLIESEIVRVEARDGRRDKADGEPRFENRPVPRLGLDAPANGAQRADELAGQAMPQPLVPVGEDESETQRGPTFPLPPRRPAAPPLQPERRPLPERAAITEAAPAAPPQAVADAGSGEVQPTPAAPQPLPPQPFAQPPIAPEAAPPAMSPQPMSPQPAPTRPLPPLLAPADRPVPTRPSPFLKPLPPRPPLRPLKRVTPQAPPPATVPAAPPPETAAEQPAAGASGGEAATAAPRPAQPPVDAPSIAPEPAPIEPARPKDGLESLEEEMAKLLGR